MRDELPKWCKFAQIDMPGTYEGIIAYADQGGQVLPVGIVSFCEGELGVIFVVDDHRRKGIGSKLLHHADKIAGQTLIDDGWRTTEGSIFLSALGRPQAPLEQTSKLSDVKQAISGILMDYLYLPSTTLEAL